MSLSKNVIQFIRSLHDKKNRKQHQLFIAEGEKIVLELIQSNFILKNVYYTQNKESITQNIPEDTTHTFTLITETDLKKISQLTTPSGILGVFHIPEPKNFDFSSQTKMFVFEEIKDPGNLGTIIRLADWFGIQDIFCTPTSVDVYNIKVVQATMGSIARVKVHYSNIEKIITEAQKHNIPVYLADIDGESIYTTKFPEKYMIVFGNESHGISQLTKNLVYQKITIPKLGKAESLNVSMATAIFMAELCKTH